MQTSGHHPTVLEAGRALALIRMGLCLMFRLLRVSESATAWIGGLPLPMIASSALALAAPGRTWGVDGWLARRFRQMPLW